MNEPKFYKATVTFQEIGSKNKVKLTSKKMTEESFKGLSTWLTKEFLINEPNRVNLEVLKNKSDKIVEKMLDGEKNISV